MPASIDQTFSFCPKEQCEIKSANPNNNAFLMSVHLCHAVAHPLQLYGCACQVEPFHVEVDVERAAKLPDMGMCVYFPESVEITHYLNWYFVF